MLLQNLTRKGPFFLHPFLQDSCKIPWPQDPAGSCKILQGCKKKGPFLVRSCKSVFTGMLIIGNNSPGMTQNLLAVLSGLFRSTLLSESCCHSDGYKRLSSKMLFFDWKTIPFCLVEVYDYITFVMSLVSTLLGNGCVK